MKKILLLITILSMSVFTTACINNFAIHELNNKAESYMNKGDSETAICRLKSSLDLDNEIFQTHYNLAVAYNNIGNYDGVITESKKVLELKPDFYDAIYIMAVAKEAIAYQVIDTVENPDELSIDTISDFIEKASDAVDTYNKYLVNKATATETEKVNDKILELNNKIKEYTDIYDRKNSENEQHIQEEITGESDQQGENNPEDNTQENVGEETNE